MRLPKLNLKKNFTFYNLLLAFFIFIVVFALAWLTEPTTPPLNVKISNITDSSATISWTTPQKRTKGFIHYSPTPSFPIFSTLPIPSTQKALDDSDKLTKKIGRYSAHHITLENLKPQTKYYFKIYTGFHSYGQGNFTTGPTLKNIGTPHPVYGQVVDGDRKPIAGVIAYLVLKNGEKQSALLSTLTNSEGRWQLDLANARTGDFKNLYPLTPQTQEELVAESCSRGQGKIIFDTTQDAPAPTIILK